MIIHPTQDILFSGIPTRHPTMFLSAQVATPQTVAVPSDRYDLCRACEQERQNEIGKRLILLEA